MAEPSAGLTATATFTVTETDTAAALGSGDLAVLGTPRLLAWLEAVTCAAVEGHLPTGQTTVGTKVAVAHRAASSVGTSVVATATVIRVEGRTISYDVTALDQATGGILGEGEIVRARVDRERFLSRLAR